MATGTYPSEHGSTNNTYFRTGDAFSNRTSFSAANTMQADTIANAAERAGKKVAQIDWVGGAAANINGPTVDFTNFFSNRGVLVGAANATEQAGSTFFGVDLPGGDGRSGVRLDERPDRRSGSRAEGDDVDDQLDVRRAEPEPHLQRLLLRQRRRRRRQVRPRDRQPGRQDGHGACRSISRSAISSRSS